MNSQPSSVSTASMVLDGGGAPATTTRTRPRPGTSSPRWPRSAAAAPRMAATTAGAPHSRVTPSASMRRRISSPSILRTTTWRPPMAVTAYGHAPAVAVEHGQGVQERVAVAHGGVPSEHRGVEPAVPVGELHPLGARRRPRGVVDRAGGGLVGLPVRRPGAGGCGREQLGVLVAVEHHPHLGRHARQGVVDLGVDEQDRGPRVLDDVADLLGVETEVHGHEHAPEAAHPEDTR